MQLIVDYHPANFDAWKRKFDGEAEGRMQAGLTLLQMWRGADDATAVTCLFQVNDRGRADGWLAKESALGERASARFLRTA